MLNKEHDQFLFKTKLILDILFQFNSKSAISKTNFILNNISTQFRFKRGTC